MVHRRGRKFGVCSARTLRKPRGHISHTGQFSISKFVDSGRGQQFTIAQKFQEFVPDGGIEVGGDSTNYADFPAYSLNKRKRWCLPTLLKDVILDNGEIEELPFRVSIVERAPMPYEPVEYDLHGSIVANVADCKSVTRSGAETRICKPRRGKYSFETDMRADRRRTRYSGMVYLAEGKEGEVIERDISDLPELVYEICYPRPRVYARPRLSPIHFINRWAYDFQSRRIRERKAKAVSIERNSRLIRAQCREQMEEDYDSLEPWLTGGEPEYSDELETSDPSGRGSRGLHLGDFVRAHPLEEKSQRGKRKRKRNRSSARQEGPPSCSRDFKSRKVFLDEEAGGPMDGQAACAAGTEQSEPQTGDVADHSVFAREKESLGEGSYDLRSSSSDSGYSDSIDGAFPFDPATHTILWQEVRLRAASLEEGYLARTFGEGLMDFAASDPFCVAINLSRVDKNGIVGESLKSGEVILLIQRLTAGVDTVALLCRFRTCHLEKDPHHPTTLLDSDRIYTVSELVTLILDATFPVSQSRKNSKPKRKRVKHEVCLPTVSDMLGWQYQCKSQSEVVDDIKHRDEVSAARPFVTYQPCAAPVPDLCEICCEDITDSEGGRPPPIALRECSHWFCSTCWQQYVTSMTHQGDVNIKCPAMDCDTPVDRVTLLSLLPDALIPLHRRLEHDRLLTQQRAWEWCQNPHCGKMVAAVGGARHSHSGDDRTSVIRCDCGYSWCQACKEAVHWPATCQQATEYKAYIDTKGVDKGTNLVTEVEVKRCPECNYPVEKNGGCMHMVCCFCKHQYCWECLSDWTMHDWGAACNIQPMESIPLSGRTKMSIEAYLRDASRQRRQRIENDIDKMTTTALKTGICSYLRHLKTLRRDLPEARAFTVTGFRQPYTTTWTASPEERDALKELVEVVRDAINIYREIGFVLEYLNVLIATSTTRELRLRRSGWRDTMDRLSFISLRLHSIISGESMLRHPDYGANLQRLVACGRRRLKEVVRAIPRVHRLLTVKNRQLRKTAGRTQRQGKG